MNRRHALIGSAAVVCLFALTGCGASGGSAAEYHVKDRSITVEPGKRFALTVPASPGLGRRWYLTDPKPDASVLKYRGGREDWKGGGGTDGGTQGTQSFDFTALAKGRATVRLLYCPMSTCHGPDDTATPYPTATGTGTPGSHAGFYVFTVTVR
ncbi:protease inhibitor I42 family protein [Streptomyces puniciscabiei]